MFFLVFLASSVRCTSSLSFDASFTPRFEICMMKPVLLTLLCTRCLWYIYLLCLFFHFFFFMKLSLLSKHFTFGLVLINWIWLYSIFYVHPIQKELIHVLVWVTYSFNFLCFFNLCILLFRNFSLWLQSKPRFSQPFSAHVLGRCLFSCPQTLVFHMRSIFGEIDLGKSTR